MSLIEVKINRTIRSLDKAPLVIEAKVIAAAAAAAAAGAVIQGVNALESNAEIVGGLSPAWSWVLMVGGPALVSFLGGFTKRSNRVPAEPSTPSASDPSQLV